MNYHVVAISQDIALQVRNTLTSPGYGHPAHVEIANGYGPCRLCLQTFVTGEDERILFTYDAFTGVAGVPAPGPIFIHRSECERYEAAEFPPQLLDLPILLEGYAHGGDRLFQQLANNGEIAQTIDRLGEDASLEYIQIRNAEAGCFMARIERVPATGQ